MRLRALLVAGALLYPLVFLYIAVQRLAFPFELEWLEGATVVHVQRVLDGRGVYVPPSIEFVPFIYTPLYYFVSASVAGVVGNGFFALRLVSLCASLGSMVLIGAIVRRRGGNLVSAVLAGCLFAATYPATGSWFDVARVDALFLVLVLASVWAFFSSRPLVRSGVAGVLVVLAIATKQPGVFVLAGMSAAAFMTRRGRERMAFPLLSIALLVAGTLLLNAASDGWFAYYTVGLLRDLPRDASTAIHFWTDDLLATLPIASVFAVMHFAAGAGDERRRDLVEDAGVIGGLVLAAYSSRLTAGGYDNVLMPLYAGVAIFFGIGFDRAMRLAQPSRIARLTVLTAALVQFASLAYAPWLWIPSPADADSGRAMIARAAAVEGPVYWPDHPWYAVMAGKAASAHEEALGDVGFADPAAYARLRDDFARAVAEKRFGAVIVDVEAFRMRPADFDRHYERAEAQLTGGRLWPIAGGAERTPHFLYVPRALPPAGAP